MRRLLGVVVSSLLVLSACGSEPDEPDEKQGGPAPAESASELMDLVAALPDPGEDTIIVTFGDVAGIAEANGLDVATADDVDSLLAWAAAGIDGGVPVLLPSRLQPSYLAQHDQFADELGVSLWTTDLYAGVDAPPRSVAVVEGDDLAALVGEALGGPDEDRLWRIGEREFAQDLSERTAARPLGESLRLLADGDDRVAISAAEDVLTSTTMLGDDAVLASVIEALDSEAFVSGMFARAGSGSDAPVLGVVFGRDGDTVVARLAVPDASSDAVATYFDGTVRSTGQPWSDLITVDSVDDADGVVVVEVSLTGDQHPQTLISLIQRGPVDWP